MPGFQGLEVVCTKPLKVDFQGTWEQPIGHEPRPIASDLQLGIPAVAIVSSADWFRASRADVWVPPFNLASKRNQHQNHHIYIYIYIFVGGVSPEFPPNKIPQPHIHFGVMAVPFGFLQPVIAGSQGHSEHDCLG